MLRDGLYSSFDRLPAGTSLGAAMPRRVQVSVFEGGPTGALKASISFMVDASGGGLGCEVEPVLLLAERTYPGVFAPRLPPAQTLYTFYYRHYAQTNAYLGISARDQDVHVLDGVTGAITNVGALPNWLALANCQLKR